MPTETESEADLIAMTLGIMSTATPSDCAASTAEIAGQRAGTEPLGEDPLGQQVVESIAFQGQILRQFGEIFPQIDWQAPFTDCRVVEAALRSPASMRMDDRRDKAVLAEAVSDVAPPGFFDKRGRGDFTTDVYDEHNRRRAELMRQFRDSRLLETGLVDPDRVRSALYEPSNSDIGLFDVESIVVAERWLRGTESLPSAREGRNTP